MINLTKELQNIVAKYSPDNDQISYIELDNMLHDFKKAGYTFEYWLDAIPFNLKKHDK